MNVTTTGLTRAAGIAAAVAGAIFIGVQINHPPMVVSSVDTTEWVLRNTAKVVMAALALAGITGMYLRQVRQMGVLGLVGYLLFSAGYLVIFGIAVIAAFVLPSVADTRTRVRQRLLVAAAGGTPVGDIGPMQARSPPPASATWSAVSSSVSPCSAPASSPAGPPPCSPSPPSAPPRSRCCPSRSTGRWPSPTASRSIGLGVSLWRDQRPTAAGRHRGHRPVEPAVR